MPVPAEPIDPVPPSETSTRVAYLDGLRGWAALVVVLFHTTWETFGDYTPAIRVNALGVLTDGPLAVFVFFVLSGLVLSQSFLRTGDRWSLLRMAVGRYPRLTVPVALASLLGLLMMEAGLLFNREAVHVVGRADWLGLFYGQHASMAGWLEFSLLDVYVDYDVRRSYDVFLWTMPIELIGSFALFGFLLLVGRRPTMRRLAYPVLLVVGWHFCPYYLPFLYGVVIADLMASDALEPFRKRRTAGVIGTCLIALACACCPLLQHGGAPHGGAAVAFVLVLGVSLSRPAQRMLLAPLSQWLGARSFPLYLVHSAVICGPGCWLILRLEAGGLRGWWLVAVAVHLIVGLSLIAAQLFSPIETLAKRAAHILASRVRPPPTTGLPRPAQATATTVAERSRSNKTA